MFLHSALNNHVVLSTSSTLANTTGGTKCPACSAVVNDFHCSIQQQHRPQHLLQLSSLLLVSPPITVASTINSSVVSTANTDSSSTLSSATNSDCYDYFCGTSYLGMHADEQVRQSSIDAILKYGCGGRSGATGTTPLYQQFNDVACDYFQTPATIQLLTGFLGPMVFMATMSTRLDAVIYDSGLHYSGLDAIRWSQLPAFAFEHRSVDSLRQVIEKEIIGGGSGGKTGKPIRRVALLVDGVFPASGFLSPLDQYWQLLNVETRNRLSATSGGDSAWQPYLFVDDAHGGGVLGENGRGTVEHFHLKDYTNDNSSSNSNSNSNSTSGSGDYGQHIFSSYSMAKAFGSHGGLLACSRSFADDAQHNWKWLSGASKSTPAVVGASVRSLQLLGGEFGKLRRQQLRANCKLTRQLLNYYCGQQLSIEESESPVLCVRLNEQYRQALSSSSSSSSLSSSASPSSPSSSTSFNKLNDLQKYMLADQHVMLHVVDDGSYTGVPVGGMIRLAVFATHTEQQLRHLADGIRQFFNR